MSGSVPLDVESIDKAMNKGELHKVKRSTRNENIMRSQRRANASKTKMWYDFNCSLGSWDQVVTNLIKQVNNKKLNVRTRIRVNALLVCADLIEKEQCVMLSELWKLYADQCILEQERCSVKDTIKFQYKSSNARDFFMKNLPVLAVYKPQGYSICAYIVKKCDGVQWSQIVNELQWPNKENLVKETVSRKLEGFVKPALAYASSHKDRQILKLLLSKITSTEYMTSGKISGIRFDEKSISRAQKLTQFNMEKKFESGDGKMIKERLKGSGRQAFCQKYPDLTTIMLNLFDSYGEGLRSHPRLICDTLFLDPKETWIDMPRCCSILQQLYDIPIKLSTAYTYTKNFRMGSHQAKRHSHASVADINLHKAARDLNVNQSINSHFCTADVQYSLTDIYLNHGATVARDNKAKVH